MTAKTDLVLLPGLMCDGALWDFVVPGLADVATPHHGNLFADDTVAGMAARVLAEAPGRFALAGFSMGGYIAREIAHAAPERVSHLALMNTSAAGSTPATRRRNGRVLAALATRPFTGLAPTSIRQALHPDRAGDAALTRHIQAMARRLGGEVFARQMRLDRADGHHRLAEIRCPTLVVASDADRLRSVADAERLAAGIPGARLEIVADCGHMTPLERPEALAGLLRDWLKETA
ncbi:MAG: alpha/beta fold hydrolase [Rhodospirillaceae bacterium]